MIQRNPDSKSDDSSSVNWPRIYWLVALFFFVQVALFYAFTRYYS